MSLVIAVNLQAIVALSARRRLYVHGQATLSDTTWSVGFVEALCAPRLLLRDWRSLCAFLLTLTVLVLEALTVLQTQPGDSCSFDKSSSWKVQEKSLGCVDVTSPVFRASQFVSEASKALREVDVDVGIPVNTDVFEKSILTSATVTALKSKEERYIAPLISSYKGEAEVSYTGYKYIRKWNSRPKPFSEDCGAWAESHGFHSLGLTFDGSRMSKEPLYVWSEGFISVRGCSNELTVSVCSHPRKRFLEEESTDVKVNCHFFEVDREGRQTDPMGIAHNIGTNTERDIDAAAIRKAMLVAIVAENSAAQIPCKRFIAVPKQCTVVGWVSITAVVSLGVLFLGSLVTRLILMYVTRSTVDWNGSPQRLARCIFECSEASSLNVDRSLSDFDAKEEEDLHISVVQSSRDLDMYKISWTRGPAPNQLATRVHSNSIVPPPTGSSEGDGEGEESLV